MKVILRTLDKKIRTAIIEGTPGNIPVILFGMRVFQWTWDREYDPYYREVPVIQVKILDVPSHRPKATSAEKEPDMEYSI